MEIQRQVELAPYNSFGVKARAAHFAAVSNLGELQQSLAFAAQHELPVQLLGGGSNVLFTGDFPGLVLVLECRGIDYLDDAGTVRAACGENWHDFVQSCMQRGLHGLENLALIPGTVGAAPIQNIGAYGVELAQFLVTLRAYDRSSGAIREFDRQACRFSYRDSLFKQPEGQQFVVMDITLRLSTRWRPNLGYPALRRQLEASLGPREPTPQELFDAVCQVRRSRLPDPQTLGNAGSFFKNPVIPRGKFEQLLKELPDLPSYPVDDVDLVKLPAAWLLEELGWKGKSRGRAAVSDRHALILVNPGDASGADILALARDMQDSVLQRWGIALEPEVRII